MFKGVALLEQELIKRVAARASGHLYATLRPRRLAAGNTSVSIEIANAWARHLPHQLGERRIVLRQEELNPEPEFTALSIYKTHSYYLKSGACLWPVTKNGPNQSRDHHLATLEVAYVPA